MNKAAAPAFVKIKVNLSDGSSRIVSAYPSNTIAELAKCAGWQLEANSYFTLTIEDKPYTCDSQTTIGSLNNPKRAALQLYVVIAELLDKLKKEIKIPLIKGATLAHVKASVLRMYGLINTSDPSEHFIYVGGIRPDESTDALGLFSDRGLCIRKVFVLKKTNVEYLLPEGWDLPLGYKRPTPRKNNTA